MKKTVCILSGLLLASIPLAASADVNSCTQQIIQGKELNSGPFKYTSATLVSSETYQGMNYHLVFLNAGGRESELVVKENPNTCENLLYNPTSQPIEYKTIMPAPVAQKLEVKLREYSKQLSERKQAESKALAEEFHRKRQNRAK